LSRIGPLERAGALLVVALAAWTIASMATSGGDALPALGILGGATLAFISARAFEGRARNAALVAVLATAGVLALAAGADAWSGRAEAGPLGYANANAALWAQAVAAGTLIFLSGASMPLRLLALIAIVVFAGLTFASGSLAATVLLALVVMAAIASRNERATRFYVVGAALLVGISFWTTLVLGAGYRFEMVRPTTQEVAEESLSTRRLILWRDAADLMKEHPLTGVGPRRFRAESQIALADPDTTETHNEFLQQGAETGIVGLALLLALFGWVFFALLRASSPALGAAAVAMLGIHSNVDYVMHFPVVVIVAAAISGAATRKTRPPEGDRA
jgi:O-antigen ligase